MLNQIAYLINVKVKRPSFSRYLTNFATASGCCCDQSQSSAAGSLDDNSCLMESSNGDARCIILHIPSPIQICNLSIRLRWANAKDRNSLRYQFTSQKNWLLNDNEHCWFQHYEDILQAVLDIKDEHLRCTKTWACPSTSSPRAAISMTACRRECTAACHEITE